MDWFCDIVVDSKILSFDVARVEEPGGFEWLVDVVTGMVKHFQGH